MEDYLGAKMFFLCDGSQWKLAEIKLRQFNRAVKALDLQPSLALITR